MLAIEICLWHMAHAIPRLIVQFTFVSDRLLSALSLSQTVFEIAVVRRWIKILNTAYGQLWFYKDPARPLRVNPAGMLYRASRSSTHSISD